jgi:hypothetical protein
MRNHQTNRQNTGSKGGTPTLKEKLDSQQNTNFRDNTQHNKKAAQQKKEKKVAKKDKIP